MTRTVGTLVCAIGATLACATGAAAQGTPVEVRATLSRTAVWIGERTTYTVELRCAPQVDVLLDDLASGRVRVEGGDLVAVEEDRDDGPAGTVRRFHYTLVTYRVDVAEVRIAPLPVRYYARRAGGVQGAPAGQVTVPAAIVAVRSAIPDGPGVPPVRVPAALRPSPRYLEIAQPIGLALIAIAIVPVVIVGIDLAGRTRRGWARYRTLRSRRRQAVSLDQLREMDPRTDTSRIEAFGRLDALVREHVALTTGIPSQALTPAEVRQALEDRAGSLPGADIEALLAACERARYAPDPPAADAWPDALRDAERIMGSKR